MLTGGTLDGTGTSRIQVKGFYTRLRDIDVTAMGTINLSRSVVLDGGVIENRGRIVADHFDSATWIDASGLTLTGGSSFRL